MTKNQILKELDGCEILSIQFEGCVAVHDGKVKTHRGLIVPTKAQAQELFQEAFEEEFGTRNVSKVLKDEGFIV